MENEKKAEEKWFDRCLLVLLAATLAVNLLSAFIRHQEAGLDCEPWPGCYGRVGEMVDPVSAPAALLAPAETAKRAHRGIATGLVLLVLLVVYLARQQKLPGYGRHLPMLLVAVILFLSVIGPASYLKTLPAVATANLAGGMALLSIAWLLWLSTRPVPGPVPEKVRGLSALALCVLVAQILLGGWTSANFAGVACTGLFDCEHQIQGGGAGSFWYLRELTLDGSGRVILDGAQPMIQQAHQLGAMMTAGILGLLGWQGLRAGGRAARWSLLIGGLVLLQVALGLAGIHAGLPLLVVLGHNLVASGLLLAVIRVFVLSRWAAS